MGIAVELVVVVVVVMVVVVVVGVVDVWFESGLDWLAFVVDVALLLWQMLSFPRLKPNGHLAGLLAGFTTEVDPLTEF